MADIKILANGVALDIGDKVSPVIQRYIFDFQNPASQGGDHTYTISLPATRTNMEAFGGAFMVDVGTTRKFTSVQQIRMEIIVDGLKVMTGTPVIERAGPQGYDITIYSTNIDWVQRISDKSIRDLTTLGESPFTGYKTYSAPIEPPSPLRMQDYGALDRADTHLRFPLVAYGNYPRLGGLAKGLAANKIDDLSWEDVPPSIYIADVFKAILAEVGLRSVGGIFNDQDFMESLMPFVGDGGIPWNWGLLARANTTNAAYQYERIVVPPTSDNSDFQFTGGRFWRLKTGSENWDYSDSYFITSPDEQYIVPTDGQYRLAIDLDVVLRKGLEGGLPAAGYDHNRTAIAIVVVSDDSDELDATKQSIADYIYISSVSVVSDPNVVAFWDFGTNYAESPYTLLPFSTTGTYSQSITGTPGTPGAELNGSGTLSLLIENVGLSRGMRIEFWLVSQDAVLDFITDQYVLANTQELDIKNTSSPDLLQLAQCLPDITQHDLIMSVVTAFNLKFTVNPDRMTIRFDTFNDFYRPNEFAEDWTVSCDDSTAPSRPVPRKSTTVIRWARDTNDKIASQFDASRFDSTDTDSSINADEGEETIEVMAFAATFEREFYFKSLFGASPQNRVIVPCMASDSQLNTPQGEIEWEFGYMPRLLKYIGLQPASWSFHGVAYTEYPAARFSFDENGGRSLAFQDNAGVVIRGAGLVASPYQSPGLFVAFWRRFLIVRRLSHIQEMVVRITPADFAMMDVSIPVVVNGKAYWLYSFVDGFEPATDQPIRIDLLRQV